MTGDTITHAPQHDRQLTGDKRFADAALAADHADHFAHLGRFLGLRSGGMRIVAASGAGGFCAAFAGRATLLKSVRHGNYSFRSDRNSGIIRMTSPVCEIHSL